MNGSIIYSQELLLVAHAAEQTNWDFENENYKRGKYSTYDTNNISKVIHDVYIIWLRFTQTCFPNFLGDKLLKKNFVTYLSKN